MAQTQIYGEIAQLQVIEETSQDTHLPPAATDGGFLLVHDVTWAAEGDNVQPNALLSGFHTMDEIPGAAGATITARIPIVHSGTIDAAGDLSEAMKSFGLEETTNASTSVVYTPLSTFDGAGGNPGPSYSVNFMLNGIRYALSGGFGNPVFTWTVGESCYIDATWQGAYVAPATDALETYTYDTTTPEAFMAASGMEINFGSAVTPTAIDTLTIDLGNRLVRGMDAAATNGQYGARISGRKTTGSFGCENETTANLGMNLHAVQRAGTTGTLTTGTIGSTEGNRHKADLGRIVLRPPELSDAEGISRMNVPFSAGSATTDVEGTTHAFTLTFT